MLANVLRGTYIFYALTVFMGLESSPVNRPSWQNEHSPRESKGCGRKGLVKGLASEDRLCSPAASNDKGPSVYLESCHQMQAADAHTVLPTSQEASGK